MLKHVRERSVTYVVQQDSGAYSLSLAVKDELTLLDKRLHSQPHQVEGAYGVLKSSVLRSRIYYI